MPSPRGLLATAVAFLASLAYVWIAAVRNVGRVKRRKRARRASLRRGR